MRNIIIDCDPGHDDVLAIMTAFANRDRFNILGITTVAGNQTLEKVTNNILKVQDHLGFAYPVSMGYDSPICKPLDVQPAAHGEMGLDGPEIADAVSKPSGKHAIEFIKECLEKVDKLTMVCIGPLTNMGLFLKTYPQLKNKIEEIVIMGGSYNLGNVRVKAEFNIYHDPEAARIVFNSALPMTMAGLEVCYSGAINFDEIDRLNEKNGKATKLAKEILEFYKGWAEKRGWTQTAIFDMTTIIYLLHPEYFDLKMMNVDVELSGVYTQGMTVCEEISSYSRINNPVKVLMAVKDRFAFLNVFYEALNKLDQECK